MTADTFEYRDKTFGDLDPIAIATSPAVFYPTSTTTLLLRGVRQFVNPSALTTLDLGCGSGVVAVVLAKVILPNAAIHASDVSEAAVQLARRNAADHHVTVDCRCGSLFEPWAARRFDVIVEDVAAMAEPIARHSRWYPAHLPSDADEDGTRWIACILSQAPGFLTPHGQLFFPVLTLSKESKILDIARKHFASVTLLAEQWYPLGDDLLPHLDLIEDLMGRGQIEVRRKGSRWLWATKIYLATNRA